MGGLSLDTVIGCLSCREQTAFVDFDPAVRVGEPQRDDAAFGGQDLDFADEAAAFQDEGGIVGVIPACQWRRPPP